MAWKIKPMCRDKKPENASSRQLEQYNLSVQDYREMNISAGMHLVVRVFPLRSGFAHDM